MNDTNSFGEYLQNILEQPQAVRDTVAGLGELQELRAFSERIGTGEPHSVLLTGMGASYSALPSLELELIGQGINARRIETSELVHHAPRLLNSQTLVIAVSQSGQSVEILKLLERQNAEKFSLIGVTNTPNSPLAAAADAIVSTQAGSEYSVSSKTYVAALAALALVGAVLTGQALGSRSSQLVRAADGMEQYLERWRDYTADLIERLKGIQQMVLAGRGPSLAAAGTGALIIREAARFSCQEMSSAAFRHGPMEMVSPQLFVLVFAGIPPTVDLNRGLVMDIRRAGGHAELVQEVSGRDVFSLPPVPSAALPLMEILPAQMISLSLARLRGHTPGKFERTGKITTIE